MCVILINDVTDYEQTRQALEESNNELKMLARSDSLTKIANRRWFDDRLREEWRRMKREKSELSLLLCDVDNLKEFNDRHGHLVGDECLKAVARAIAAQTKRPADLAARYGGDEFAIILPNTSSEGAGQIAGQLSKKLHDLKLGGGTETLKASVSMSIGISSARPSSGKYTVENLLSNADDAMYEAKKLGKDRVVTKSLDDGRDDSFNFRGS
jgi:diguanylate cyclase (GGDEF)-like protein